MIRLFSTCHHSWLANLKVPKDVLCDSKYDCDDDDHHHRHGNMAACKINHFVSSSGCLCAVAECLARISSFVPLSAKQNLTDVKLSRTMDMGCHRWKMDTRLINKLDWVVLCRVVGQLYSEPAYPLSSLNYYIQLRQRLATPALLVWSNWDLIMNNIMIWFLTLARYEKNPRELRPQICCDPPSVHLFC